MHYTRTALGLLSAQYRSVLKKCFLINLGLFALGAVTATPAMADCPDGYTCYTDLKEAAYATGDRLVELQDGEVWKSETNMKNMVKSDTLTVRGGVIDLNNKHGLYSWVYDDKLADTTVKSIILENTEFKNGYNRGDAFSTPYEGGGAINIYTIGDTRSGAGEFITNVKFTNNRVERINSSVVGAGGAILHTSTMTSPMGYYSAGWTNQENKNRVRDLTINGATFTGNSVVSTPYYSFGGAVFNLGGTITNLQADFKENYTKSTYVDNSSLQLGSGGGAVMNYFYGNINAISGTYEGNHSDYYDDEHKTYSAGGAIFNTGTIGNIGTPEQKSRFVGNYVVSNAMGGRFSAMGGAVSNYGNYNRFGYFMYDTYPFFKGFGNIENIYADFSQNEARSIGNSPKGSIGGAIANVYDCGVIKNIVGNFDENKALAVVDIAADTRGAEGGAIYNDSYMRNITGNFSKNVAFNDGVSMARGGAISNIGYIGYEEYQPAAKKYDFKLVGGIINSNFYDNVAESTKGAAFGGAIHTTESLSVIADNGTSEFKGNKTISKSALADKEEKDEAIFVYTEAGATSHPVLTLKAVNNGVLTMHDSINGTTGYTTELTGDASGTINLYNDIFNGNVTADSTNINTANDKIKQYDMYNLSADNTAKWTIDFDVKGTQADSFATETETADAGKVVQINHFNLTDGQFDEVTYENFKVQILKTQGSADAANLQLALTDNAQAELGDEFFMKSERNTTKDGVEENTNWSRMLYENGTKEDIYGKLGLATTDTLNDSIGITVRKEQSSVREWLGDTLWLVNIADLPTRNFNADQDTYKVTDGYDNIGTTHAGELNINGQGKNVSTLDGNGAKLFDLSETGTTVSLNDVKVTNAAAVATLTAADAKLNLNNAEISGNSGEITANAGTIEAVNTNFYNNSGTEAGAIVSSAQVKIVADNGTSEIKDNAGNAAIYMKSGATPQLNFEAKNNGVITLHDAIDGEAPYAASISGDTSGTVQLYNDINNADVAVDTVKVETNNGVIKDYTVNSLSSDDVAKWAIDVDVENQAADRFITAVETPQSGNVVLLDHFEQMNGDLQNVRDENFKVQILQTQGSAENANIQLALSDNAQSELEDEFILKHTEKETYDVVGEDTNWSDMLYKYTEEYTKYGKLGLATTDTLNDSIGVNTREESASGKEWLGDTLKLVNTADLTERNFNADQATYKVSDGIDNIGVTHAGTMNVNGVSKDESVLDGNGAKLFDLSEAGTTVSLNNVKVTNAATVATLSASDAKLNLNNAEISGNSGEITANAGTIEAVNTNFYNNSGTEAGAIVSSAQVKIVADNGTSEIKDNAGDAAIYMKFGATPQLNFEAKNDGVITLHDAIDGEAPYAASISGDTSGTVQLYNDINNADVAVDTVKVETNNGVIKDYTVNSLSSDDVAKWAIDVDVENQAADRFITAVETPQSGNVVLLDHFEQMNGDLQNVRDENFKVQILKTQGSADAANIQLALSDNAKSELGDEFILKHTEKETYDVVGEDTNWSDMLYKYTEEYTKYGKLGLATTDTLNDSIGVCIREDGAESKEWLGDTLALVNQAELTERNFNADQGTYKVSDGYDNIGTTHAGELNINGQGKDVSTLDGNGAKLFDLSENRTTVSLNNVKVTNAQTAATLTAADAVLNLNNVELSGNRSGIKNEGMINLSGANKIADDISGSGTTNVNSDWVMESKISGNNVNVNNAKLTVGKDNLAKDVNLHATEGGEVVIGNNLIGIKDAAFDAGSQLTLDVDNLSTFGGIRADSFRIQNGSTIDITFGQNVLHGETEAEIPVLALTDGSDIDNNNFTDAFHNNMYGFFRKSDKSGIYTISQKKTAREISRENGGTIHNQDTAGSWVDGPSHGNPTAQGIADDLARIAQKDGNKFNEELTALAPADSAILSFLGEINNRVFYAVDNYLRNDKDENRMRILTPKEKVKGRPNLDGVNIWLKPYYGQSKHQQTGKVYGFDTKSYGIIAGVDKQITKDIKLGLGGRYEEADMNTFHKDYDISTSSVYGYGEYKPNNWFINGIVKWDVSDWNEKRYALNRTIKAHYSVTALSSQLLSGYEYRKNHWFIIPQAGLRWHHIYRHGYVDEAWQTVSGRTMDVLSGVAGIHIQKDMEIRGEKFRPDLYIGVAYDFISDRDRAMVTLSNGERYKIESERLKRLTVEVSPSITYNINDKWSANIQYTGAFREHYQNHTGFAGIKYEF